jgi:hypothetical protein
MTFVACARGKLKVHKHDENSSTFTEYNPNLPCRCWRLSSLFWTARMEDK